MLFCKPREGTVGVILCNDYFLMEHSIKLGALLSECYVKNVLFSALLYNFVVF